MPFVKLDTGILVSTLWIDRDLREVFITALLMAEPVELDKPARQIQTRNLEETGFEVPPGWYGLVRAAGVGIIARSGVDMEPGFAALEKLAAPDLESRTSSFQGRRMVRVDGGYIILNYMKYRDRDYTAAERMRRLRERRKLQNSDQGSDKKEPNVQGNAVTVTRNITQAESREQSTEAEESKTNSLVEKELFDLSSTPETFSISKVFDYFCNQADKSKAYILTDKRKKQGMLRWKDALKIANQNIPEAKKLIQKAIDALCSDEWMEERGFVDWEQIFRSTENFTKWIEIYDKPRKQSKQRA